MNYKIFSQEPQSHLLNIEMLIDNIQSETLEIQLPAWRPGRYELQHFAKNIQRFEIVDLQGNLLSFGKITKDRWRVNTTDIQSVKVVFTYFANVQNAGSSFVDDSTMYINFVNCLPYVEGRMDEACEVSISLPDDYKIVCGLPSKVNEPNTLLAQDYYHLVDCPLLASPYLQHKSYRVSDTDFFVWFLGNYIPNWEKILSDFQKFTEKQIEIMGDFPEKDYHFMNWILPTSFYHGVEHRNSTMIVLGPASEGDGLYTDLLGVSSHELYHAWNICKIRPIEMMPYDFTKENYFSTGFVAEGVTTYFGDLFLVQSGVFNIEAYLKELETVIKRHFEQDGRAFQSLTESSYDLWLDGYSQAIPNRRVSIYQKGAVVALILDLMIRLKFGHRRSLGSIMQLMWERFGKTGEGYSIKDYQKVCEEVYAGSLKIYFKDCIEGNIPLEDLANELLQAFGISMQRNLDGKIHLELLDSENENLKLWLNL